MGSTPFDHRRTPRHGAAGRISLLAISCWALPALAADGAVDARLQERANAVVSLMTFNVIPDITSSNLDISGGSGQQAALTMSQLGGGATMSKEVPIYLEGNLGYSRYDPKFVISQGAESRFIPAKWNSLTATGGIGWDFTIAPNWVLRPIANFSLGTVASDIQIGNWYLNRKTGRGLDFLDNGRLNVYGLGGSLMLDYELFSDSQDIDAEFRYSFLHLQSTFGTSPSVRGEANAENIGIYLRRRAPLFEWTLLDRPLRYVLEGARTEYLGDQRGLLGFNALNSIGVGFELDSSKYQVLVTRTRLMYRFMFGNNTSGYAIGLAMSF
ncbi:hypothetical protein ACEUDJ_14390 [Aeromonas bivalvium]|uniref:Autotransporter domain-containing protein n=1 Tax=Aeromonas bivalvium TaxID=440079 RepID=A0ABW9GSE2_9GAMM